MDSLNKRFSSHRPKRNPGESNPGRRNKRERFGSEQLAIVPVPPEELPEEMRSVLESVCADCHLPNSAPSILIVFIGQFISSQQPPLVDARLTRPDVQDASTSGHSRSQGSSIQGYEGYDYDGRNDYRVHGPNSKWPYTFSLKGKKIPSRVYHTHKVVPRSRPNAKEQLGKRKWNPSRRHGRVIQREDYDAYGARELGQQTQFLNGGSSLDFSVMARGGAGCSRLQRWSRSGKNRLGELARKVLCRD